MALHAFPTLDVTGSPKAVGRAHGESVREAIQANAARYREELSALELNQAEIAEFSGRFLNLIGQFDLDSDIEMRGIAEGSGVSLTDICVINCRTELISIAGRRVVSRLTADREPRARIEPSFFPAQFSHPAPEGCTGIVVLPGKTINSAVWAGQNWEGSPEMVDLSVILRVTPETGPKQLRFTEVGQLARFGVNSAGIALTGFHLGSEQDGRRVGIPLTVIRRKVLSQVHPAWAIHAIASSWRTVSNCMALSFADGTAVCAECSPDRALWMHPMDGLLVHANHWESAAAGVLMDDEGLKVLPDSLTRRQRAQLLLENLGRPIGFDELSAIFQDKVGWPYSICRGLAAVGNGRSILKTIASIIFDVSNSTAYIARDPSNDVSYQAYKL